MKGETKQEELKNRVTGQLSRYAFYLADFENGNGDVYHVEFNDHPSVDWLLELINSEVLSALEEIEKSKTTMSHVTYDFGHAMEVGRDEVIPLSAIESIKNRYKL